MKLYRFIDIRNMRVSKLPPIRLSRYGREKRKCWSQLSIGAYGTKGLKSGFPALASERYFLADNESHDGDIWA